MKLNNVIICNTYFINNKKILHNKIFNKIIIKKDVEFTRKIVFNLYVLYKKMLKYVNKKLDIFLEKRIGLIFIHQLLNYFLKC